MGFKIVPFISEEQIDKRVKELGEQISKDYKGKKLKLVVILKGAVPFACKLIHEIDNDDMIIDFMAVSSYGNEFKSSGIVRILKDLDSSIEGDDVLIVEDIVDTGLTFSKLMELLSTRKPASIKICTMLNKPSRRISNVKPDYVGFDIEDVFVAGFGLDYEDKYRQIRYVGRVEKD